MTANCYEFHLKGVQVSTLSSSSLLFILFVMVSLSVDVILGKLCLNFNVFIKIWDKIKCVEHIQWNNKTLLHHFKKLPQAKSFYSVLRKATTN